MKFIVYTLPYAISNEADKINQLFESGLDELHIRKPGYSKDDLCSLLNLINRDYHPRIVLHHHYSLMKSFILKGIHLPNGYFNGFFGKFKKIKFHGIKRFQLSTTIDNIKNVEFVDTMFDIVFIGPMYKKLGEQNSSSNFDAFEVKNVISSTTKNVYAYGGIEFKNQHRINQLGFKGMVLQSSLWKSGDVVNTFNAFLLSQAEMGNMSPAFKIA